jgi:hypothetical protein
MRDEVNTIRAVPIVQGLRDFSPGHRDRTFTMPSCVGLRTNGQVWQTVGSEISAAPASKKVPPNNHAERKKYTQLDGMSVPILLVQDAFPCKTCHEFFLAESKAPNNRSIIVKVEKNDGDYSLDHAPNVPAKPGLPVIIYYSGGAATYVFKSPPINQPPGGFPAHPDFAKESYYGK